MSTLRNPHIIDEVISIAHEFPDPSTIAACALVSSTWREFARRFVLRQIRLSSEIRLSELTELLDRDHSTRALVHVLIIQSAEYLPSTSSPWAATFPQTLSSKLPSLHTIRLTGLIDFADVFGEPFIAALSQFTTVESLFISHRVVALTYITAIASALPHLRHLHIDLAQPFASGSPALTKIYKPRLLSLGILVASGIETYAVTEVLTWMSSTPSSWSLRSLRLGVNFADAEETGRILNNVGSRLTELELTLDMAAPTVFESEG